MPNSAPKIQLPTGCNTRAVIKSPNTHRTSGGGIKKEMGLEKQRPEKHQRSVSKIPSGDTRMMMMIYHLLWYRGEVSLVQVSVIYEDE